MSNCETHDVENLTREYSTASVHNWCPECRQRICLRCSKAAPESWMSGSCHDCYRIISRDNKAQQAEYARKREMEKLADAWDEGRASIALDFLNPVGDNGMRQSSINPYRLAELDGASRD